MHHNSLLSLLYLVVGTAFAEGAVTAPAKVDTSIIDIRPAAPAGTPLGAERQRQQATNLLQFYDLDARIEGLERNLDALLARHSAQHPDVVSTKRVLAELRNQRQRERSEHPVTTLRAFDFKGLALGAPATAQAMHDKFKATCVEQEKALVCKGLSTIVERDASVTVTLREGQVYSMMVVFHSLARLDVREAVEAKFGSAGHRDTWYNVAGEALYLIDVEGRGTSALLFSSAAERRESAAAAAQAEQATAAARERRRKDL